MMASIPTSMRLCWFIASHSSASRRSRARSTTAPPLETIIAAVISAHSRQRHPRRRIHPTIGAAMNTAMPAWNSIEAASSRAVEPRVATAILRIMKTAMPSTRLSPTLLLALLAPAVGGQARGLVHVEDGDREQQQQADARVEQIAAERPQVGAFSSSRQAGHP